MLDHYRDFARYNAWANTRLYDACEALSDEEYRADLGAFFHSLHGTLNHLLVGDRVWMGRFRQDPPAALKLDQILYENQAELRAAREAEDTGIISFFDDLTAERVAGDFSYRTIVTPMDVTQPLGPALAHFFNHQTHHRGQCHALLTRLGRAAPPLDLLYFQRERKADI